MPSLPDTRRGVLRAAPLLVLGGLLAGCVVSTATPPTYPFPPVPAPLVETIPKPPVTEEPVVWRPGHYDWTGASYVWSPGLWVPKAGHGELWMPGYWAGSNNNYAWVPAHWQ